MMVSEGYLFEFSGGALCLDFANTITDRLSPAPSEYLHGYDDLVSWGGQGAVLAPAQAEALRQVAERRPAEAQAVYGRAIALREAIYRSFARRAVSLPPREEDLEALNRELATALARARLVAEAGGLAWGWEEDDGALDRVLWPVARSAAELLTAETAGRVRECAADDCNWLFVDTSKNRSRRWCDMNTCGNRAKAKRHYERKKGGGE